MVVNLEPMITHLQYNITLYLSRVITSAQKNWYQFEYSSMCKKVQLTVHGTFPRICFSYFLITSMLSGPVLNGFFNENYKQMLINKAYCTLILYIRYQHIAYILAHRKHTRSVCVSMRLAYLSSQHSVLFEIQNLHCQVSIRSNA